MKKILFLAIVLLNGYLIKAQTRTKLYQELFDKSDSLYESGDFREAALTGSLALRIAGKAASFNNYRDIANAWALASYPDSAFYLLDIIANLPGLTMRQFDRVRADKDFTSLRTDKRWKPLLDALYKQAEKGEKALIDIIATVKIKLRDGTLLHARVYKPHYLEKPLPVIFQLTPYIGDTYHERGVYFAKNGFVYANVDVRGRDGSDGEFEPFYNDAKDGFDIVEWFAKQPYCNGKITMWGRSYSGTNQWLTAKEFPPHLRTIVPVASPKLGVDHPNVGGVGPYLVRWLTFTGSKTYNLSLFDDDSYWTSKFRERYEKDLPFASLDSLVGYPNSIWKKYVAHPTMDSYYKSMNPDSVQYSKMNLPILTITGSFDVNQRGALAFYREYMKFASSLGKENHYLLIGPWDHGGTRTPAKVQGGITMGDSSVLDMNNLHRQWYNYTLKDSIKPAILRDKVMYFVMNTNIWKSAATLEEIGREKINFYLNPYHVPGKMLTDSGALQKEMPANGEPAVYIYDPLNKTGNDSVIYYSAPFENDLEISGVFQLNLFIETNVKDVDIETRLFEIRSNGTKIPLINRTMRARYRESLEKEKLLVPGEINLFQFNTFNFISRVIEKGSRIRLEIMSPNSIGVQKNYCSGGNVAFETAKDAKVATVKIFNDSRYPSVLIVPVGK